MAKAKRRNGVTGNDENHPIIDSSEAEGLLTEWHNTTVLESAEGAIVPARNPLVPTGNSTALVEPDGPLYFHNLDLPAHVSYPPIGSAFAATGRVYRNPDKGAGLICVPTHPGDLPQTVTKGSDLGVAIKDRMPILLFKKGKPEGDRFPLTTLNDMVRSERFLRNFPVLDRVADRPEFYGDFQLTEPGYNDGGEGHRVYYTGPEPKVVRNPDAIKRFLDVMAFASNADWTNALAAALTVQLRHFWPGDKPFVLITSTKSHGGKDTILDFVKGETVSAGVSYERTDWAFQKSIVSAIKCDPRLGVVDVGNVRKDRGGPICSAFLERFLTEERPVLHATGTGPDCRRWNHWVVAMTTNNGVVSTDLMNRALPIHLTPKGDVGSRASPIGNPRYDYLPANRDRIAAELRGMVARWDEAGRPLGDARGHSRTNWAKTVGGILAVNGYTDFLGNLATRRTSDDPVRSALALLASVLPRTVRWMTPSYLAGAVAEFGLTGRLIPSSDRESSASRERALVKRLNSHVDETFDAEDELGRFRLERRQVNGDDSRPAIGYRFVRVDSGSDGTK